MQSTRNRSTGQRLGLSTLGLLAAIAACSPDAAAPLAAPADAAARQSLATDCTVREADMLAPTAAGAIETGVLCANGPFAESGHPVVNGQYADAWQIQLLNSKGQGTYITTQPILAAEPDWDRTGRRIYYSAYTNGPDAIFWVPAEGGPSVQVPMESGGDPNYLGDGRASVSPNNRELVTERAYGPFDGFGGAPRMLAIYKSRIDGSHPLQLSHPGFAFEDHGPRWSPQGRRVVFQRIDDNTGLSSLWIVNADGSDEHQFTPPGFDGGDPDWSPNGDVIIYESPSEPDMVNAQRIYSIRPNGTDIRELTHGVADPTILVKTYHPRFSPDGRRIVFGHVDAHTTVGPDGQHHGDLFTIDRDGSNLVQVTHSPDAENAPAWGPRGH